MPTAVMSKTRTPAKGPVARCRDSFGHWACALALVSVVEAVRWDEVSDMLIRLGLVIVIFNPKTSIALKPVIGLKQFRVTPALHFS